MKENEIYCGNSIELLDQAKEMARLVILHPPDISETGYSEGDYLDFLREIYKKAHKSLGEKGVLASINTDRKKDGQIFTKHTQIENIGRGLGLDLFDYKIWAKTLKANLYVPTFAHILFFREGRCVKNISPEYRPDVWLYEKDKVKSYPTKDSFPVDMIKLIIRTFTNKGDLVLDPFVGSGTTCVAASQLGRKYIGFDISEKFVNITRSRL